MFVAAKRVYSEANVSDHGPGKQIQVIPCSNTRGAFIVTEKDIGGSISRRVTTKSLL